MAEMDVDELAPIESLGKISNVVSIAGFPSNEDKPNRSANVELESDFIKVETPLEVKTGSATGSPELKTIGTAPLSPDGAGSDIEKQYEVVNIDVATKYMCRYCAEEFENTDKMKAHLLTHNGTTCQGPYSCYACHKMYNTPSKLRRHVRVHSGEKPYSCKECGRKFSRSDHVKQHMKVHQPDRLRYECHLCDTKFQRSHTLSAHMKTEHKILHLFCCADCGEAFRTVETRRLHRRLHGVHIESTVQKGTKIKEEPSDEEIPSIGVAKFGGSSNPANSETEILRPGSDAQEEFIKMESILFDEEETAKNKYLNNSSGDDDDTNMSISEFVPDDSEDTGENKLKIDYAPPTQVPLPTSVVSFSSIVTSVPIAITAAPQTQQTFLGNVALQTSPQQGETRSLLSQTLLGQPQIISSGSEQNIMLLTSTGKKIMLAAPRVAQHSMPQMIQQPTPQAASQLIQHTAQVIQQQTAIQPATQIHPAAQIHQALPHLVQAAPQVIQQATPHIIQHATPQLHQATAQIMQQPITNVANLLSQGNLVRVSGIPAIPTIPSMIGTVQAMASPCNASVPKITNFVPGVQTSTSRSVPNSVKQTVAPVVKSVHVAPMEVTSSVDAGSRYQAKPSHRCEHCCIWFEDSSMYLLHSSLHNADDSDPFTCKKCLKKLGNRLEFMAHLVWHLEPSMHR